MSSKTARLDRMFLHRACIQFSCEQRPETAEAEHQHATTFIATYAPKYPDEIVRALAWRVWCSSPGADRFGAWALLNSAMRLGTANPSVIEGQLTDRIVGFLPTLVRARWIGAQQQQLQPPQQQQQQPGDIVASSYRVVTAADASSSAAAVAGEAGDPELVAAYAALYSTWKKFFTRAVVEQIRTNVKQVATHMNQLTAKDIAILTPPKEFEDSLWKLRRKTCRPTIAADVWRAFGGVSSLKKLYPTKDSEIELLAPMHPRVREWLRKYAFHGGGDIHSDSWKFTTATSPCTDDYVRNNLQLVPKERALAALERAGFRPRSVSMAELTAAVLDAVTRAIARDEPFEELLNNFDSLRGRLSAGVERRALFIHATYSVMPSRTGLQMQKPTDQPQALRGAIAYFEMYHRHNEKKRFLHAVQTIFDAYALREFNNGHRRALTDVNRERSFLFYLLDPRCPYAVKDASMCPEAVLKLAEVLPSVSRTTPLRMLNDGEMDDDEEELWDHAVATEVLAEHNLLGASYSDPATRTRISDITQRFTDIVKKNRFLIAVELLLKANVPYSEKSLKYGAKARLRAARQSLARYGITPMFVRLFPTEAAMSVTFTDDVAKRDFEDAIRVFGGANCFPREFGAAVKELQRYRVPLAAARFDPDAVERHFQRCNKGYMVRHIDVVGRAEFPSVCAFCSSFDHASDAHTDLPDADRAHVTALSELLRQRGVSLEDLCRRSTAAAGALRSELENGNLSNAIQGWMVVQARLAEYRRESWVGTTSTASTLSQHAGGASMASLVQLDSFVSPQSPAAGAVSSKPPSNHSSASEGAAAVSTKTARTVDLDRGHDMEDELPTKTKRGE